jgi:hypothetical protein
VIARRQEGTNVAEGKTDDFIAFDASSLSAAIRPKRNKPHNPDDVRCIAIGQPL